MPEQAPCRVFLGLGSNQGQRAANLDRAVTLLAPRVSIARLSSFYDTAPQGNPAQPRFLNAVCEAETALSPAALLGWVKEIEGRMGRRSGPLNSPRPIDIDILLYGNIELQTPELVIPHPRLAQREFVLRPLAEIAPGLVPPGLGANISRLLEQVAGTQGVQPWRGA
jgi:2-amino-4-hydroxy-6-hydroxymethyldihydropteridine diphosphokinase